MIWLWIKYQMDLIKVKEELLIKKIGKILNYIKEIFYHFLKKVVKIFIKLKKLKKIHYDFLLEN